MPIRIPKGLSFVVSHKRAEHGTDANMSTFQTSDDHYEISYIIEGQRQTTTLTDVYYVNAPCVATSPIHSTHQTSSINDSPYERILIKITVEKYKEMQKLFGEEKVENLFLRKVHYFSETSNEQLKQLFLDMEKEFYNRSQYTKLILTSIFTRIIAIILRDEDSNIQCEKMKNTDNQYINHAIRYTLVHFMHSPTIEQVADYVSLSTSYFQHLFKEETGVSYNRYLTIVKLERARNLLINSNCNMEEIALMSGFDNGNYLATVFKKHVGITPRQFRKEFIAS